MVNTNFPNRVSSRKIPKRTGQIIIALMIAALIEVATFFIAKSYLFPPPLRELAERRNFWIGVATAGRYLNDPLYVQTLTREFNIITPESALKFGPLSSARGQYDFSEADTIIAFAKAHDMQVRGHTLVWTNQLPEWLTQGKWTRDELIDILHDFISTTVGRYRGQIYAWDVVNEALNNDGVLAENNFWFQGIGPEYIELAFRWAREADPNVLLFYNESYAEGLGKKSDGVFFLVKDLLDRGVPIDGVGMQMHTGLGWSTNPEDISANMQRLADLSLQVQITEMDVRIVEPATQNNLEQQAQVYGDILAACLDAPNCTAFVMWGLTDAHSWIPYAYPGTGSALIFTSSYEPKPAYYAILDSLKHR
jgi:endo-1,4-beta-xylanase